MSVNPKYNTRELILRMSQTVDEFELQSAFGPLQRNEVVGCAQKFYDSWVKPQEQWGADIEGRIQNASGLDYISAHNERVAYLKSDRPNGRTFAELLLMSGRITLEQMDDVVEMLEETETSAIFKEGAKNFFDYQRVFSGLEDKIKERKKGPKPLLDFQSPFGSVLNFPGC